VAALKSDLIGFQQRYEKSARPFEWTYTRRDLHDLLAKLNANPIASWPDPRPKIRRRNYESEY
jgi:hypothetical protein